MSAGTEERLTQAGKPLPLYRNRKNGRLYEKHGEMRDCTNSRDGTLVIAYAPAGSAQPQYVREAVEFSEKFEAMVRGSPEARAAALTEMTRIAEETDQYKDTSNPLDRSRGR